MASTKSKSSGPTILANNLDHSKSPHANFCPSTVSSSSSAKPSSMSNLSFLNRIVLHRQNVSSSPPVRFSTDHHSDDSPGRSVTSPSSAEKNQSRNYSDRNKKTCMCSPSTHPGSFRCSIHRKLNDTNVSHSNSAGRTASCYSHRLYARRSALTNSLVRIGTVEGDLVKRAKKSLIRPSSHHQRRRGDFQPRPSRLSVMSTAGDEPR